MGCGCGEEMDAVQEYDISDFAFDKVVHAMKEAMAAAWDLGFREGAKTMIDTAELVDGDANTETGNLEDLVEADAVALDSALTQVQALAARLEFVENQIGLKYTG